MDSVLLTKYISVLVYPLGLFFVLYFFSFIGRGIGWRKLSSILVLFAWLSLLLASNPYVATKLVRSLEQQYPQVDVASVSAHDAIIVLGGGLRIPLPPSRYTQITAGSDRYWHATRLYKAGKSKIVMLAGGNVFRQPGFEGEAHYAAELLQEWGVPSQAIKIETASRTTEQNVRNIRAWLQQRDIKSLLLVTSAYHMPRALMSFSELPITVTPLSSDVLILDAHSPDGLQWLPSAQALSLTTLALHEYYGMAYLRLKRIFS